MGEVFLLTFLFIGLVRPGDYTEQLNSLRSVSAWAIYHSSRQRLGVKGIHLSEMTLFGHVD